MKTKLCTICNQEYKPNPGNVATSKYCSMECYRISQIERVDKICPMCNEIFTVVPSKVARRKYCSRACQKSDTASKRAIITCPICVEHFSVPSRAKTTARYCSYSCANKGLSIARKGEKSWLWRGGTTEANCGLRAAIMNSPEYRKWKRDVRRRDNYTCQDCGCAERLHVHHIIKFQDIMTKFNITTVRQAQDCDALWDANNGIVLCESCHLRTGLHGAEV